LQQVTGGTAEMQEPNVDQSTMQLIIDQFEELLVTIIDEVRQRPGVAVAILAGVAGALVGSMLAARLSRRRASPGARPATIAATSEEEPPVHESQRPLLAPVPDLLLSPAEPEGPIELGEHGTGIESARDGPSRKKSAAPTE